MDEVQKLERILKALATDKRIRIIQLLKKRMLCVNALAAQLDISPAAVSQHLRILRDIDLVVSQKRGYFVHYAINRETLDKWRNAMNKLLESEEEI